MSKYIKTDYIMRKNMHLLMVMEKGNLNTSELSNSIDALYELNNSSFLHQPDSEAFKACKNRILEPLGPDFYLDYGSYSKCYALVHKKFGTIADGKSVAYKNCYFKINKCCRREMNVPVNEYLEQFEDRVVSMQNIKDTYDFMLSNIVLNIVDKKGQDTGIYMTIDRCDSIKRDIFNRNIITLRTNNGYDIELQNVTAEITKNKNIYYIEDIPVERISLSEEELEIDEI